MEYKGRGEWIVTPTPTSPPFILRRYNYMKKVIYLWLLWLIFICPITLSLAQTPIDEITQLVDRGEYSTAISKLKELLKSLKQIDGIVLTYNKMGKIYYEYLHDYPSSIDVYKRIISLKQKGVSNDELIWSWMQIGDAYCRTGKYDSAITAYQNIVNDYPPSGSSLATIRGKIRAIKNAIARLKEEQKVIEERANTPLAIQARFRVSELYWRDLNTPQKAIEEFEKLIAEYPHASVASEAQWWIGHIYSKKLYKYTQAISAYQKVIQNYPTSNFAAESQFQIGNIYKNQGEYQQALQAFLNITTEYPSFWRLSAVFYWQGVCYEHLKDYSDAIGAYRTFVTVYLPEADYARLGDIGKYKESKLKIEDEIETKIRLLREDMPRVEYQKAEELTQRGEHLAIPPIYRKIISTAPDSQYAKKAREKLKHAELMSAIQRWQHTIDEQPDSSAAVLAQFRIAETYEEKFQNHRKAVEEYRKIVTKPQEPSWAGKALYRIGSILYNLEDTREAIEAYTKLIAEYPESTEAMAANYQLGEIYRSLNKYVDALKFYHKTIAYPGRNWYSRGGYVDSFADAAQFRIGVVNYENLRNLAEALSVFEEFVKTRRESPRLAACYVFIGLINQDQKKYKLASDAFQKAYDLVLNSNSVQAAMIAREVKDMDFGGTEPVAVLKRLRQKLDELDALEKTQ